MWHELLKAARSARKAHSGQVRKHGEPYFHHPMAVAAILWKQGHREISLLQAAYLHDTLEDTQLKPEDLRVGFGAEVERLVLAVTHQEGEELEAYYHRIKAAGPDAVALKIADRIHNESQLHLLPVDHPAHKKAAHKAALIARILNI
jgi:GTP pyrophosphokinase